MPVRRRAHRLREHVVADDIWDRVDQSQRLQFALLDNPGPGMFNNEFDSLEDDTYELAVRAHPEYDDLLREAVEPVDDAGVSPSPHLVMHSMVSNQLWLDTPPEAWQTARRLQLGPYDQHEIHHMLAFALSSTVHRSLAGEPVDDQLYLDELTALPGSWEDARPAD